MTSLNSTNISFSDNESEYSNYTNNTNNTNNTNSNNNNGQEPKICIVSHNIFLNCFTAEKVTEK